MDKISDKNLICIILTAGLALLTIGNAFHSGNWVLGCETVFMWLVLYSFQPLSKIIDIKIVCPIAKIDYLPIFKQTIDNKYLFISFCTALLLSMVFDDILNYTGRFVENAEFLDLLIVYLVFFSAALVSISFYYLTSKIRIEKLITKGQKIDVIVENIKYMYNKYFVTAYVINPVTGEKQKLISETYTQSKEEIPRILSVYFDKKNPDKYFFDVNTYKKRGFV